MYPALQLIAGNVATAESGRALVDYAAGSANKAARNCTGQSPCNLAPVETTNTSREAGEISVTRGAPWRPNRAP
jgi:hypothetical protein